MSEIKFKSYGELDVAESLSDISHMLIEENGEVKRYPAKDVGGSATASIVSVWDDATSEDKLELQGSDFETLTKIFESGSLPDILFVSDDQYYLAISYFHYGDGIKIGFYDTTIAIHPDNSVTYWAPA